MLRIEFNHTSASAAIKRAIEALVDPVLLYSRIGDSLLENRRDRFVRGTDAWGRRWAPKSEATLARYERLGYGRLSRPLIGATRALSDQIKKFVSRDGVVIGSALAYSGVMQRGAARGAFGTDSRGRPLPWGRIPARPWIDLSDAEGRMIVEIADEYIAGSLDG